MVEKSEDQKKRIEKRLNNSFMFNTLENKDKKIIIDAMKEVKVLRGQNVISQNDNGDELYVVESGHLECFKRFPGQPQEKLLRSYNPGESFGELALLYNAPRYSPLTPEQPQSAPKQTASSGRSTAKPSTTSSKSPP